MIVKTNNDNIRIGLRGSGHDTLLLRYEMLVNKYWVTHLHISPHIDAYNNARGFRILKLTKRCE